MDAVTQSVADAYAAILTRETGRTWVPRSGPKKVPFVNGRPVFNLTDEQVARSTHQAMRLAGRRDGPK